MANNNVILGMQPTVEDHYSSQDEIEGEHGNDRVKESVRLDTAQNAAASPLRDGEKNLIGVLEPRKLTLEEETDVYGYIEDWKEFNRATPDDSLESIDLCLESEDLIAEALGKLNTHQRSVFKACLKEQGYEVRDRAFHLFQAKKFGLRLPDEYLCANISKELQAEAIAAAHYPPEILRQSFGNLLEFDPYRREWSGRLRAVQDKYRARQNQEAGNLPGNQFRQLLTKFESEGGQIPPPKPRPLPDPPLAEPSSLSAGPISDKAKSIDITDASPRQDSCKSNSIHTLSASSQQGLCEPSTIYTPAASPQQEPYLQSPTISTVQPKPNVPQPDKMTISTAVALPLPVLPEGWTAEKDFKAIGNLSPATQRSIEPVGPHYLAHARRARHKRTFSEDDRIQAQENVKKVEDDDAGEISEPEDPAMLLRDAKDWKGQDHYAVLGLTKYRWKATEEQIKRAHRKKVLRHHPDKKAAAGSTEDDSFFKCIQKATEILLDPVKRRQYDSVDDAADIEPPTKKQTEKGNFYKLWSPVFKAESRFSRIQPVPKFGDENSTKDDVDNFYNFWYNFDSWRSFEYQDEDVPDDNENRDQKRHMERKNANARRKKKTEDSARLRRLLDDCSALDPRIKKFRQEASASKNKKRLEKEAADKKAAEEAKAKKEAEEKSAKEAEEAAKLERDAGKKAKEAAKNAVKKNKRVLKGSVKDANYFVKGNPPAATIDAVLNDVELVQGKVDADEIAALAGKLNGLKVADEIKTIWSDEVKRLVAAGKLKQGDAKTLVV